MTTEASLTPESPPPSNTGTILLLSVLGLAVVGGGVYAATRSPRVQGARDSLVAEVKTARALLAQRQNTKQQIRSELQGQRARQEKRRKALDAEIAVALRQLDNLRALRRGA